MLEIMKTNWYLYKKHFVYKCKEFHLIFLKIFPKKESGNKFEQFKIHTMFKKFTIKIVNFLNISKMLLSDSKLFEHFQKVYHVT